MTLVKLQKVSSLRSLYPFALPIAATDSEAASALQKLCPKVTLRPAAKGITIVGARGRKRFAYPFRNDSFFQAAIDLQ
jgi:hypothetical protein